MNSNTHPLKHLSCHVGAAFNLTDIGLTDTKALCELLLGNARFNACHCNRVVNIIFKDEWNIVFCGIRYGSTPGQLFFDGGVRRLFPVVDAVDERVLEHGGLKGWGRDSRCAP